MTAEFYDAADWRNLPHGSRAMLYFDGEFAVPPAAQTELKLDRYHYITVTGNHGCGAIDWEPRNPCFTDPILRSYVRGRRATGHRARVYVQMSLAAEAIRALTDGGSHLFDWAEWWIPTLDGHLHTPQQLAQELRDNWDAPIPPENIWAQQWTQLPEIGPNAKLDVSTLYTTW